VENFSHRFVLLVVLVLDHDLSGVLEHEDEEENEDDGAIERFSHKLFTPLRGPIACVR